MMSSTYIQQIFLIIYRLLTPFINHFILLIILFHRKMLAQIRNWLMPNFVPEINVIYKIRIKNIHIEYLCKNIY